MATAKPRSRTGKNSKANPKEAGGKTAGFNASNPFSELERAASGQVQAFPAILSKEGSTPEVGTVVYVHGIGNKPKCSVLKCQWDTALFGASMGDRTRMAYWVDRNRYPQPVEGSCADGDRLLDAADAVGLQALADIGLEREPVLDAAARKLMDALEARLRGNEQETGGVDAKLLPLPEVTRLWITRRITKLFLKDVQDFFFDARKRALMEQALRERLDAGGGPFIVIGHSQGSMIAYQVLRQLQKADCDVRLFVTIGSPLGLQEVKDGLRKIGQGKPLVVPECVDRWLNVAERLDPVALDAHLANDYKANSRGVKAVDDSRLMINPDWKTNPHSGTGYLSIDIVRNTVREAAGPSFSNPVGRNILMKDLVADIEDGQREQRHPTLIQLVSDAGDDTPLAQVRDRLEGLIRQVLQFHGATADDGRIQVMQRYISADLTRSEIEQLRSHCGTLKIDRVWRNAVKRALLNQSTHTLQVRPANLGYGACGRDIGWAVLDTGISAAHPHFKEHANVVAQWDCTLTGSPRPLKPGDALFGTLDGNGHGTHVAATIAGGMTLPNDDGDASAVAMLGMAPEARLYGFKVLKDSGSGEDAFIIKALDQIAELNERAGKLVIHGINLSLGGSFDPSVFGCGHTPMCQRSCAGSGARACWYAWPRATRAMRCSIPPMAPSPRTWICRLATRPIWRRPSPSGRCTRPIRTPMACRIFRRAGPRPTGA